MNVINDSKIGANKETTRGYIASATYSLSKTDTDLKLGGSYIISSDGNLVKDSINYDVDVKGKRPTGGAITFNTDGKVGAALLIDDKCYVKYLTEDDVIIINDTSLCGEKLSSNLVVNGYGELSNNTNFSTWEFANNTFFKSTSVYILHFNDEFISIDKTKKYEISADVKSNSDKARYYMGFAEYDIDKNLINNYNSTYTDNTLTTLKRDLNNGDTIVYLDNVSNFIDETSPFPTYRLGLIFWNYKDSTGYQYPALTYSRNAWTSLYDYAMVNKINKTITLKVPWNNGTFKA